MEPVGNIAANSYRISFGNAHHRERLCLQEEQLKSLHKNKVRNE